MEEEIKKTKTEERYIIHCPNCETTFCVEDYLNNWKMEMLRASEFLKHLKAILQEEK